VIIDKTMMTRTGPASGERDRLWGKQGMGHQRSLQTKPLASIRT